MLSSDLIPLVAEAINTKPRKLGLAGKAEQALIKAFRYHLGWKLKTAMHITFFVWDETREAHTIGYMPIESCETAECQLATADRRDIDAEKWFEVLCEFSNKCISNGSWRTDLLCLDQAESLLAYFFSRFDSVIDSTDELITPMFQLDEAFQLGFNFNARPAQEFIDLIEKLGYVYSMFELPERSIQIAELYYPLIKQLDDDGSESATLRLDLELRAWSDHLVDLQGENEELRETASILVNKAKRA